MKNGLKIYQKEIFKIINHAIRFKFIKKRRSFHQRKIRYVLLKALDYLLINQTSLQKQNG